MVDEQRQEKTLELLKILHNTDLESGKQLLKQFMIDTGIEVTLLDENNMPVEIMPQEEFEKIFQPIEKEGWTQDETVLEINFTAPNPGTKYLLIVSIGKLKEINEVTQITGKILPQVCLVIISVSVIAASIYSRYITKPISKISKISRKFSKLDFTWECEGKRIDEIGTLEQNINHLSEQLLNALTELKRNNLTLANDLEKERVLEKNKQDFFSAASHELKTPLTIIKGQLEGMIYKIGIYQDRDVYLKKSLEVTENMEKLVQEILTISRIGLKETLMKTEQLNFTELIRKQVDVYSDLIRKKQLTIDMELEEVNLEGNPVLLERVISNLLNNAIKYSPMKEIIRIQIKQDKTRMVFTMENTGVHIPEEELSKLTQAFYRIEQSRNKKTGGSGLGLYVVKVILDQQKADLNIGNTKDGVYVTVFFTQNTNKQQINFK